MSAYVPDPWTFILLALAAWRVFKLISSDVILEAPVDALLRRISTTSRRTYWREFLECPYCLGAWLASVWWLAWLAWPHAALIAAVPWALSAVVALVETGRDALSE